MNIAQVELRKLLSFKVIYIALFFCLFLLTLFFYSSGFNISSFDPEFWKSMRDFMPRNGAWFVAIMIVVGISRMLPYEIETGIDELLKTYKQKTKLLFAKLYVVFIYCLSMVTLFYGIAFVVYGWAYSLEGYNLSMAEVNANMWVDLQIGSFTQWQYLLYEYTHLVFISFSYGLCVLTVSLFVKKSVWVMAVCGGFFALFEFFDGFLGQFLSTSETWSFLFVVYKYSYNGMLHLAYLERVDLTQLWQLILYLVVQIVTLTCVIIITYKRRTRS